MDAAEVLVTAGGAALIGLILWFFFGPRRSTAARPAAGEAREAPPTDRARVE